MDADTVIKKIEHVDIQGATAVATAGVELLQDLDEDGATQDDLTDVADRLRDARPTEPFLSNAVNVALATRDYDHVLDHINTAAQEIHRIGTELITDGNMVFTHCHSSTVTGTLIYAFSAGTDLSVCNTETRPLYQGRTTAEELADAGIPVKHGVDAAAQLFLEQADAMMIGADAVTRDGYVVNKVGSGMFARIAQMHDVPVYVLTDSWKFDGSTDAPDLELRDPDEVWDAPTRVDLQNYAFEPVHPEHVTGIVSELGEHEPSAFAAAVQEEYPDIVDT